MDLKNRNERMTRILAQFDSGVSWDHGAEIELPLLRDHEGDAIVMLPAYLCPVLDAVSDDHAGGILIAMVDCCQRVAGRSFSEGRARGSDEVCSVLHKALGIDRLVAAIRDRE